MLVQNHNIRVISEGSCDTKDWSNHYISKHIQIENS